MRNNSQEIKLWLVFGGHYANAAGALQKSGVSVHLLIQVGETRPFESKRTFHGEECEMHARDIFRKHREDLLVSWQHETAGEFADMAVLSAIHDGLLGLAELNREWNPVIVEAAVK